MNSVFPVDYSFLFQQTLEKKNVVVITSSISTTLSCFSKENRKAQTVKTIKSIREKIPNSFIIFSDTESYPDLSILVDKDISTSNKENKEIKNILQEISDTKKGKQIGDFLLFKEALFNLPANCIIENIFKISGRYWLNDTFYYEEYNNQEDCFKESDPVLWKNTVATCFFKIAFRNIENIKKYISSIQPYFIFLIKYNYKIDVENIFYGYTVLNKINHMHSLGVSGMMSITGIKGSC